MSVTYDLTGNAVKADSFTATSQSVGGVTITTAALGATAPTASAAQGSLIINTTATTTTNRIYINTNGTTGWASLTASA